MCVEIYQSLRILLKKKNLSTAVGDEGGFAPDLKDSREILELILEAVKNAGYEPGKDIGIAIDAAASELYDGEKDGYYFPGESKMTGKEVIRDSNEMIRYYENLLDEFPVVSIEDGLQEFECGGIRAGALHGREDEHEMGLVALGHRQAEHLFLRPLGSAHGHGLF